MKNPPTNVTFVAIPRFNMMTMTTIIEPMRIANYLAPQPLYRWDYRSPQAGTVTASNGLSVECAALAAPELPAPDVIFMLGSWGADHYDSPALTNWLRRRERTGARVVGVELGVYSLARAGLLAGHRATTHWSCKAGLVEAFPQTDVSEQLYTLDPHLMTCAGGTAGIDLMLRLIAEAHGEALAAEVAQQMIHHPRPPEARQRDGAGGIEGDIHPDVRAAMALLEQRVEEPPSVAELCREIGVSQRQLERLFRRDTGCTIVQFGKLVRLQYARVLLTSTRMSIREVSASCGFNSMSYFSLCFLRTFGKKPSKYRRAWPENEPAPSWPGTLYSLLEGGTGRLPPG
ncbi:MAG: GlxA family transcriptional regulator [Dongiaceae bacterium]